jgi:transposase
MLRPLPLEPIPPETARVARAAFPKGSRYRRGADALETLVTDDAFRARFPMHGPPAHPPWRLALVTLLQCAEGPSARQAAAAVRRRLAWKDVRRLALTAPGFDASVLRAFPTRLITGAAESLRLETLLPWCRDRQLVKARGRQRTASTPSLAAVRALNRLESGRGPLADHPVSRTEDSRPYVHHPLLRLRRWRRKRRFEDADP